MDWQDALYEIMEIVKSTAPHLWRIARRQVYAEVAQRGIWTLVIIASSVGLWKLRIMAYKLDKEAKEEAEETCSWYGDGWKTTAWVCTVLSSVCIIIAFSVLAGMVMRLINPDYYAIQILLDLAK